MFDHDQVKKNVQLYRYLRSESKYVELIRFILIRNEEPPKKGEKKNFFFFLSFFCR